MKQKLIAIAILVLTVICVAKGELLIAMFTVPAGLLLLFSKRNWLYNGKE